MIVLYENKFSRLIALKNFKILFVDATAPFTAHFISNAIAADATPATNPQRGKKINYSKTYYRC